MGSQESRLQGMASHGALELPLTTNEATCRYKREGRYSDYIVILFAQHLENNYHDLRFRRNRTQGAQ